MAMPRSTSSARMRRVAGGGDARVTASAAEADAVMSK